MTLDDLKYFLDKRMDMVKEITGWLTTSIIVALGSLIAARYFAKLGLVYEIYLGVIALIVISAILAYTHFRIGSFLPLLAQRTTMEQYLLPKEKLCKSTQGNAS